MKLTHKAVVLMCGYKIVQDYRDRDGSWWKGGWGQQMYNICAEDGTELSTWHPDEEYTCKLFAEHYELVEKS